MAETNDKLRDYKTDEIVIYWSQSRCIHFAACVRGLPQVFDPNKRPWIQAEHARSEELIAIVKRCPTGALHYEMRSSLDAEPAPTETTIFVSPDGPLYLKGDLTVECENQSVNDTRMALCRCGASDNKPFCDGSHSKVSFKDSGSFSVNQLKDHEFQATGLKIKPLKNGPILLEGNFSLKAPADSTVYQGSGGALCRCGKSEHKPFCDGSHSKTNFRAD